MTPERIKAIAHGAECAGCGNKCNGAQAAIRRAIRIAVDEAVKDAVDAIHCDMNVRSWQNAIDQCVTRVRRSGAL